MCVNACVYVYNTSFMMDVCVIYNLVPPSVRLIVQNVSTLTYLSCEGREEGNGGFGGLIMRKREGSEGKECQIE